MLTPQLATLLTTLKNFIGMSDHVKIQVLVHVYVIPCNMLSVTFVTCVSVLCAGNASGSS